MSKKEMLALRREEKVIHKWSMFVLKLWAGLLILLMLIKV